MNKNKRKSFLIKSLLFVGVLALIIFAMNKYVLPWFVSSPEEIVPKLVGMTQEKAVAELEEINLQPVIADTIYNEKYDIGVVILQKPRPEQVIKDGIKVHIFISDSKQTVNARIVIYIVKFTAKYLASGKVWEKVKTVVLAKQL